jgi:ABC-type sugar transport system ATPase subunit
MRTSASNDGDVAPMSRAASVNGSSGAAPALNLVGVTRSFGATKALKGIDLEVARGTVHALVGENGAGKSTCLGIIAGRIQQDSGDLEVFGKPLEHNNPRRARSAGIVSVYQELTIVPELTSQANVFLGQTVASTGVTQDRAMKRRYRALCEELGVACHADVKAGRLSVADQQLLEIMRALISEPDIVLLDEPTASLAPHEREVLLRLMRDLRDRGITIVFVSHNLDEVLEISDRITVFREGQIAREAGRGEVTKDHIVKAMLGRALDERPEPRRFRRGKETRLRVEHLTVPGAVSDISFDLAPGEILGIGGLVGSGRTTILRALAGASPTATGRFWMDGKEHRWPRSPRMGRKLGITLLPEDRKTEGLVGALSGAENIVLADLKSPSNHGLLFQSQIRGSGLKAAQGFGIDTSRLSQPASNLSGGNQQKLLLARCAHSNPSVLLADEPTRGIDVGAKQEILAHLQRLADGGMSIVIVSSELEEVVAASNRILVLAEGEMVATLESTETGVDEHDILKQIFKTQEGSTSD